MLELESGDARPRNSGQTHPATRIAMASSGFAKTKTEHETSNENTTDTRHDNDAGVPVHIGARGRAGDLHLRGEGLGCRARRGGAARSRGKSQSIQPWTSLPKFLQISRTRGRPERQCEDP